MVQPPLCHMPNLKTITIVGGGLAGLTLGIGLRRQGVPSLVVEAGSYPRHRVCGEFISGGGLRVLTELGLTELLRDLGAVPARQAMLFVGRARSPSRTLPSGSLCLSRFTLDAALAERFAGSGGELRVNTRWAEGDFGPGIVCATGRRRQSAGPGERWFGLKAHARGVPLEADLEMHSSPEGYVGLCRLRDGLVNVCGLFRRHDSYRPD